MLEAADLERDLSLRGFVTLDGLEAEVSDVLSTLALSDLGLDLNLCLREGTLLLLEAGVLLSDTSASASLLSLATSTLFLLLIWTLLFSAMAGGEDPEAAPEDLEAEVRALYRDLPRDLATVLASAASVTFVSSTVGRKEAAVALGAEVLSSSRLSSLST